MRIKLALDWDYPPNPYPNEGERSGHFVGRQDELSLLSNDLVRKDSGSILVSGERGIGKTSLVYAALKRVEGMTQGDGRVLLPVILNASQLQQHIADKDGADVQPVVIQSLIRRLYSAVYYPRRASSIDKSALGDALENLYRKAVAHEFKLESSSSNAASDGTAAKAVVTKTLSATPNWPRLITSGAVVIGGLLASLGLAGTNTLAALGSMLVAIVGIFGLAVSYGYTSSVTTTAAKAVESKASEYYMVDNDIGNLESDLEAVLATLRKKHRVVFVVDEMDKLLDEENDSKQVLSLIRGFKNLFTLSPAVFVFITSEATYEQIAKDRESREVDATLFTHMFFIKRPEHADLDAFIREVGSLEDGNDEGLFAEFIDYACFAAGSDFTLLYEVLRDHATEFDAQAHPVIALDGLSRGEQQMALMQKAVELVYDRYRYARPSGWRKNESLLGALYAPTKELVGAQLKEPVREPRPLDEDTLAVVDLLGLLERHAALVYDGQEETETQAGEPCLVRQYLWTGKIDPIGDDALDAPTTFEASVLEAERRLDVLTNQILRVSVGMQSGKTPASGRLGGKRFEVLADLTGLDLGTVNEAVRPVLGALKAKPIGHKTREEKQDAATTLAISYEEVTKVAHRAAAASVGAVGVLTTDFVQNPLAIDERIRDLILESELPYVLLLRQDAPERCAVFLLEADKFLLARIAQQLKTRNTTLRVVDVRCSSEPLLRFGDKSDVRGVMSLSFAEAGAMVRRLRSLRNWLQE